MPVSCVILGNVLLWWNFVYVFKILKSYFAISRF